MPVMDGLDAAKAIRELERREQRAKMPIVALTGHTLGEVKAMCEEAGMDDVLTKPITKDTVLGLLLKHVP